VTIVADIVDAVVGIDTHRDTHQVEIATALAVPIATCQIRNDSAGFSELRDWITRHAPGPRVMVGIEGARSYGIGLNRSIQAAGLTVVEVEQPSRKARRSKGKSDPIDAHLAVVHVLGADPAMLATPRADGDREALRILLIAREELTGTATATTNRLRALLLNGEDRDRDLARGRLNHTTLTSIIRRKPPTGADRADIIRHQELRRLAINLREDKRELTTNNTRLIEIVTDLAPGLLDRPGIGPVTAAQTIVAFSHPGRCRDDAAFAALAGTNPIPASSGHTTRHRLNRGGDRQLNRAIHTIAITRTRICPRTKTYIARRTAEGKTPREIRRCLKRYITRELFKALNATLNT
jgi:transposase